MFGLTSDEEIGATHAAWQARIHPEDLPVVLAKVRAYQENPSERLECEYRVRHRSGVWIWVLDRGRWLGDTGRQLMVGTLLDISSRKEMEQRLLRMAITDPLTGLSNRLLTNDYSWNGRASNAARRYKQHLCSAISITSSASMIPMGTDAAMRCSSTLLHG